MIISYHINLYSTSSLEKHYSISVTNNLKLRKKSWQLLDGVWSEIGYQILAQVWNSETAYISLKYTNSIARGCWGACDPNTTAYSRGRKCHDNSVWHSVTPPPWKILGTPCSLWLPIKSIKILPMNVHGPAGGQMSLKWSQTGRLVNFTLRGFHFVKRQRSENR